MRLFLSYILFAQIPDEGLDELLKTMLEIAEFYAARANYTPPSIPEPQERWIRIKD